MSTKSHKSTSQSSKTKRKSENFCSPCGNSYESEKKLYEHCCGLLHQVRRKENEKNFKPCCFMCKKTYPTLDAYGDHLHEDSHKESETKFKQAIEEGKTVRQLVNANLILSPMPTKPNSGGVDVQKNPEPLLSAVQPPPNKTYVADNNFSETPNQNDGWNFDQSNPPPIYNSFCSYPAQRFPGGQYQYYGYGHSNIYNWQRDRAREYANRFQHPQGNESFDRFQYSNGNNFHQPQNYPHALQGHNQPWQFTSWRNPHFAKDRNAAYFETRFPKRFQQKHVGSEDNSALNTTNTTTVKRQHIYYSDNEKETENGKEETEDNSGITNTAIEGQTCSTPKSTSENKQSTRRKLSPQDFVFALPESQAVDNSCSDKHASHKKLAKSPRKAPRTPNFSPTAHIDGCSQQSPKAIGGLDSPKTQQQLNAENLRNLVNLSCSRKDKFLLDKLMCEYDQMTLKAAMNRMGQNLVTLVDKDAAKDVIASLSAFGLMEPGSSGDPGDSSCIPEQLMGKIEELLQRSCRNGYPLDGYGEGAPLQDYNINQNIDYDASQGEGNELENPQSEPGLAPEKCSPAFDRNLINSEAAIPKKKTKKKKARKGLPSEQEDTEPCKTTAQDYETVDPSTMQAATPKKKKKTNSNSKKKTVLPQDEGDQENYENDDAVWDIPLPVDAHDQENSTNDTAVSACIDPQKKSKKKTVSDKGSSKKLAEKSPKEDVQANKSKSSKLKSNASPLKTKTKKSGKAVTPTKKKKTPLNEPIEDNDSPPEPVTHEEDMADINQGHETTTDKVTEMCNSPRSVATTVKCEVEDRDEIVDLPDVIEEPNVDVKPIKEDIIDLDSPEAPVVPQPEIPVAGALGKPSLLPIPNVANSSNSTIRALNFAIEDENIQCEIQHIERRLVDMKVTFDQQLADMKVAFERQVADMEASFEREVKEAKFTQEKLKERQVFVRQQCDSLMKRLLKSQDGKAIASTLKRIFTDLPSDLRTPEDENPIPNVDVQNDVPLRELPQSEPMQTEDNAQDTPHEELSSSAESADRQKNKRKRLDTMEKTTIKKSKTQNARTDSINEKSSVSTEQEEVAIELKTEEPIRNIKKEGEEKAIKKEEPVSPLSQMLTNCKDLDKAKFKQVLRFPGHVADVVVLKIHKSRLYSCSNDGTIRRFKTKLKDNLTKMKCVATYTHQCDKVVAMEIVCQKDSEDCILTANQYGTLKKFDLYTGRCLSTVETKNELVCMNYRWGSIFVSFFDGNISRHSLMSLKELDSFPCSSMAITCATTATEGAYRILCIGSGDGLITLKEAHSGLFIRSYSLEDEYPFKIQVLKENSYTLGCKQQQCRTIFIHKMLNGDLLQKIDIVASVVSMQVISPSVILVGGKFGVVRLFDPKKKPMQLYFGGGYKTVSSLCLLRNLIISGGEDGTIEACKLNLGQTFVCKYGKCPGKFAYQEDIILHVQKIHAVSSLAKCLACDYTFQNDRLPHILSHVQLHLEQVTVG